MSYAPIVRWESERQSSEAARNGEFYGITVDGTALPAYKPIDWLIDNTPLDKPLFVWAQLWGVAFEFEAASQTRQSGFVPILSIDPPPITKQPSTKPKSAAAYKLPPGD